MQKDNKSQLVDSINIFSDGGSRGNPGPASYGFVAFDAKNNQELFRGSGYLGVTTNNQAEYRGVVAALEYIYRIVKDNQAEQYPQISVFLDSELIVKQMNGQYKIKNEDLAPLYWQIRELMINLGGKITFAHIRREKNKIADKLVNEELDRNIKQTKNIKK